CMVTLSKEVIELALKHPNLVVLQLDVTDPNSIKAAAQRVEEHVQGHGLNLLINNAGIGRRTSVENENMETMAIIYLTNTVGPLLVSQAFLPLLKKAAQQSTQTGLSCSKAAILNMSSIGGSIEVVPLWEVKQAPSYRCSKAALNMLTRCWSLEYKSCGILCTSIHPGWVKTRMGTEK
ncbi:hydroxysteroid (17-beta) dehydrogenase 2, partial [Chelydra serpentina]